MDPLPYKVAHEGTLIAAFATDALAVGFAQFVATKQPGLFLVSKDGVPVVQFGEQQSALFGLFGGALFGAGR